VGGANPRPGRLRRLEHDGLIERYDRSFTVRATSPEQVLDNYEIRIALEGIAARSAAEHRSSFHRRVLYALAFGFFFELADLNTFIFGPLSGQTSLEEFEI
jgi:hypothetical protein